MKIKLERPICFFDLETTGTDISNDRICSISVLKLMPDGSTEGKSTMVNPTIPIPKKASDIHGITDDMVVDKPTFKSISKSLLSFFIGCDIAGYNGIDFDIPLLSEEFARVDLSFPEADAKFLDAMNIFKKKEERTLKAAYKYFCNKELEDAHDSKADTYACMEVLLAQIERYDDIGGNVSEIAEYCKVNNRVDLAGKLVRNENGDIVYSFGKCKDTPVIKELGFANWMLNQNFTSNTKKILLDVMSGKLK